MSDTESAEEGAQPAAGKGSSIPDELLEILVCPLGKKPLRLENVTLNDSPVYTLVCTNCGARFKIEDGIPNMLLDEATLPDGVTDIKELACHTS